jgi:hypothetical protein
VAAELNGLDVMRFDGSNDRLVTANAALHSGAWTAFAVAKRSGSTGTHLILCQDRYLVSGSRVAQYLRADAGTPQSVSFNTAVNVFSASGSATVTNWNLLGAVRSTSQITLFANGAAGTPTAITGTAATANIALTIGALQNNATTGFEFFFGGDIAEIVMLPSDANTFTRQRIEGYLAHKWGLEGSLPSDHPYKSAPPTILTGPIFTTLDPANRDSSITLSNGDLTATKGGTNALKSVRSVLGVSSGKHYFEITVSQAGAASPFMLIGVGTSAVDLASFVGNNASGWGYYQETGNKFTNNSGAAYGANWLTNGDIIGVALDMDAGKVWFRKNGTWQASGDPAAGTNEAFSGLSGTMYAYLSLYRQTATAQQLTANFGATAFAHTPPAGFRSGLYHEA